VKLLTALGVFGTLTFEDLIIPVLVPVIVLIGIFGFVYIYCKMERISGWDTPPNPPPSTTNDSSQKYVRMNDVESDSKKSGEQQQDLGTSSDEEKLDGEGETTSEQA
jgi:hypothetical protein